jgi:hypothetical protein
MCNEGGADMSVMELLEVDCKREGNEAEDEHKEVLRE